MADTTKSDTDTRTTKTSSSTKSDTETDATSTSTRRSTKSSTTTPSSTTSSYGSTSSSSIPTTSTSLAVASTQRSISTTPSSSSSAALATAAVSSTSGVAAAAATLGSTAHDRSGGLSTGATAAAVIVPIVVVAGLGILFFFWFRRRRQQKQPRAELPTAGSGSLNSYGSSSQTSYDTEKQDKELEMSPMTRTAVATTPITRRPVAVASQPQLKSGAQIAVNHHSPTSSDLSPSPPSSPDFTSYSPTPHHPSGAALLPPMPFEVDTGNFFNDVHDSSVHSSDPFDDPRPGHTPSPVIVRQFTPFGNDVSPVRQYVPLSFRPSHPSPPTPELTPMPSIAALTHPSDNPTRPSTTAGPMSPADPDSFSLMSGPEDDDDDDAGVEYASAQVAQVVGAGAPARNRASVINMGQNGSVSDEGSPRL